MVKRVCDVIASFLEEKNVLDVFMVSGGGSMFLTDGLVKNNRIRKICCHHEQAVAMAVVGYAKYKGMGCGFVTTGCGGTNTITGVLDAWQDSTACMFFSGQCKMSELLTSLSTPIRQLGVQEVDIVSIVDSITKYAVTIKNAEDILYELEKAYEIAKGGRPGPVWIDVPMNIQQALVDTEKLRHYCSVKERRNLIEEEVVQIIQELQNAKRPVIIAGHGIRLSDSIDEFQTLVETFSIPFVYSRLGLDLLPFTHELNYGGIGNTGTRHGNFVVQNADYILVLGSRLCVSTTGYAYDLFARGAKVHVVDIDIAEHNKCTVKIDKLFCADLREFFTQIISLSKFEKQTLHLEWVKQCKEWKKKYTTCESRHYNDEVGISMYAFMNELSSSIKEDSVILTDAGSTQYVPAQALITNSKKQRYITSGAQGTMGFSIPASIGVSVARRKGEVIVIVGDGSLQMNIQELQTIITNQLPIKIFVWDNDGYLSIRETQARTFEGRFLGVDSQSGVSFPDLEKLSDAYGLKYYLCDKIAQLSKTFEKVLNEKGPVLCHVHCIRDEKLLRTVSSKRLEDGRVISLPIEDMIPFLERDEFYSNMIVEPVQTE